MISINLDEEGLIRYSTSRENSILTKDGALCTFTGEHTGRSPNAKKIVLDNITAGTVDWNNNSPITEDQFNKEYQRFLTHRIKGDFFIQEVFAVRDPQYSLGLNIWTEFAKHSLFVRNMFIPKKNDSFEADYEVYHFPSLSPEPQVLISFKRKIILISGTLYSGEIKKSVFTVLNFMFPEKYGFLPMHCSVNIDQDRQNPTIFFGLSGTGKTTLSSDDRRLLIGDDEHGWTDKGLVNFEGGCYAKTIRLSQEDEPQIWNACHSHTAMYENVVINNGIPDFNDGTHTENTRASYSTSLIDNADEAGYVNAHPKNIVMLTCDAFGVLPPVMKLSPSEAVKQFLLGYTAKVAGTESGISEPVATFSPCFGLPFMPLPPRKYAEILKGKIINHNVDCWLVNTGWSGGGYGVGKRMPIKVTRAIIDGINDGSLSKAEFVTHKHTSFAIPKEYGNIPTEILQPELSWDNEQKYTQSVKQLFDAINNKIKGLI